MEGRLLLFLVWSLGCFFCWRSRGSRRMICFWGLCWLNFWIMWESLPICSITSIWGHRLLCFRTRTGRKWTMNSVLHEIEIWCYLSSWEIFGKVIWQGIDSKPTRSWKLHYLREHGLLIPFCECSCCWHFPLKNY